MALSGYTEVYFGQSNGYRVKIEWSATQNESANQSTVNATSSLHTLSTYTMSTGTTKTGNILIDGNNHSISRAAFTNNGNAWTTLGTASRTLTHGSDGRKSFSFGGSFAFNLTLYYSNGGTQYVGTITVPTITETLNHFPKGMMNVKVSGSWRTGQAWVKVSGTWRKANAVYVKHSGSWRQSK